MLKLNYNEEKIRYDAESILYGYKKVKVDCSFVVKLDTGATMSVLPLSLFCSFSGYSINDMKLFFGTYSMQRVKSATGSLVRFIPICLKDFNLGESVVSEMYCLLTDVDTENAAMLLGLDFIRACGFEEMYRWSPFIILKDLAKETYRQQFQYKYRDATILDLSPTVDFNRYITVDFIQRHALKMCNYYPYGFPSIEEAFKRNNIRTLIDKLKSYQKVLNNGKDPEEITVEEICEIILS